MAVIFSPLEYSLQDATMDLDINFFETHLKPGFELDPSPKKGKLEFDNYLLAPNSPFMVESNDAQVPDSSNPPIIMDLSAPVAPATVLDTPAIIDSFVDVLPFPFPKVVVTEPADELTPTADNAILGFEVTEKFQDLTHLILDPPLPSIICSPSPIASPTDSVYSDITQSSSTPLLSAASTSSDTIFFASNFELLSSVSVKSSKSTGTDRYSEMRIKNNMASRRSRLTRRERERDMEKQLNGLFEENASLKSKVKTLEELVEKTKRIIIQAVAKR